MEKEMEAVTIITLTVAIAKMTITKLTAIRIENICVSCTLGALVFQSGRAMREIGHQRCQPVSQGKPPNKGTQTLLAILTFTLEKRKERCAMYTVTFCCDKDGLLMRDPPFRMRSPVTPT